MQTVRYAFQSFKTEVKNWKNRYELSPSRGWLWLQRICFWILSKVGAFAIDEIMTPIYVVDVKPDDVAKHVIKQIEDVYKRGHKPKKVLIGSEQYAKLMGEVCHSNSFSFAARVYSQEPGQMEPTFHGLTIHVVPWIDGVLVLQDGI